MISPAKENMDNTIKKPWIILSRKHGAYFQENMYHTRGDPEILREVLYDYCQLSDFF